MRMTIIKHEVFFKMKEYGLLTSALLIGFTWKRKNALETYINNRFFDWQYNLLINWNMQTRYVAAKNALKHASTYVGNNH